jgi:hypothetical protein
VGFGKECDKVKLNRSYGGIADPEVKRRTSLVTMVRNIDKDKDIDADAGEE